MVTPNLTRKPPSSRNPISGTTDPPAKRSDLQINVMRTDLREFLRKLRLTLAVTMMTVKALQRQAAESDEDLALVLQRHVCDVLGIEIDKWEACLQA